MQIMKQIVYSLTLLQFHFHLSLSRIKLLVVKFLKS